MKVHVKMRQADIPGGLSTLLNKAVNNMVEDVSIEPGNIPDRTTGKIQKHLPESNEKGRVEEQ